MKIYNCCSLCLEESKDNGDSLIWRDSMQLCKKCYDKYTESGYSEKNMCINAIKKYRKMLSDLLEE